MFEHSHSYGPENGTTGASSRRTADGGRSYRWNLLTVRGIPVLRVTHSLLTRKPEHFLALVRAAIVSHQSAVGHF
jgi:hypothetical protein